MNPETNKIECREWIESVGSLNDCEIDLFYVDPPFNTGKVQTASAGSYQDSWATTDAWVEWFSQRISATIPKIKQTGSILIHVDWRASHRVRVLLDELLGEDRFVNHLIWRYGLGGSSPRRFARKHDDILFYCIDPKQYYFEPPMVAATSNRMKGQLKKATDVLDVPTLNNMADERVGYPTQKPLALLKMLVGACCPADGLVYDPCCGSGTTLVAAQELGRKFIGSDQSEDAVRVAQIRLCR
ncbi:MAG: site-specific DNA-methyltransferase [Phycisphaerales bacterium]|nr:site-specific DNA-methyltransferase [Phycisphaerales bacterium]